MALFVKCAVAGFSLLAVNVLGAATAFAGDAGTTNTMQSRIDAFVAARPGSTQIGRDTIRIAEDHYITFSDVLSRTAPQAREDCPADAYCWFEHIDWGGAIEWYRGRVQCYTISIFQILNNKASSWVNNSGYSVRTIGGFWERTLYFLNPYSADHWVGNNANDANHYFCTN
jgi:hypothetical protein